MAPRKTAAQKAAEAAEREEYTGIPEQRGGTDEQPSDKDKQLSNVKDEKTGKTLTIQQLKNKLRNEAEREVLDKHKSEVVEITAAKYKEHNLEYVRRLTDKEKAQKQIEELYAQYPELRPQPALSRAEVDKLNETVQQQQAQVEAVPDDREKEPVEAPGDEDGYADYADN
jgi:hypothetical protein